MYIKTKKRCPKKGFTLIELLVVIAIITLLLSMLMPSLKTAKEKSRQTVCSTNLSGLTKSWELYSIDNQQKLCPPFTGGNDGNFFRINWVDDGNEGPSNHKGGSEFAIRNGLMWQYVENLKLYKCPTDKSKRLRSYAMSFAMGGGYGGQPGSSSGARIVDRDGIRPEIKVPRTSGKLVFIDSEPSCPCSNRWIAGSFIPLKATAMEWNRNEFRSDMTDRHSGKCNVAYADGSCGSWKWKEPETIKFIKDKSILSLPNPGNEDMRMIIAALTPAR